jgi:phosphate transport system ATP-binding protein
VSVSTDPAQSGESLGSDAFEVDNLSFFYGSTEVLHDVTMTIPKRRVTALIGPSGSGKTTFLRCLNRMNDLVPGTRVDGKIRYDGQDLYADDVRPIELRRRIGMVFQRPNPFPKSIYENVAIAPRLNGHDGNLDDLVEESLTKAGLWEEVKSKLKDSAFSLSGGQQQRLCIARAIAVAPEVILMDEPASALDPIATFVIEDLIADLKREYTIVIVTHNMQQAGRVSDLTAFFTVEATEPNRYGVLVEMDSTERIFSTPDRQQTQDYVSGRFG